MTHKLKFILTIVSILLISKIAFSQNETSEVEAKLSTLNTKKIYQIGEPLPLILTFTTQKDGFVMNKFGSSQRLEEIRVKAFDETEWKTPFKTLNREHVFYFYNVKLSETPSIFEFSLNTAKGFPRPGKYLIQIDTKRVSLQQNPPIDNRFMTGGKYVPLTTNPIEIEIKEMTPEYEKEELIRLTNLLESEKDFDKSDKYAQDISFLVGTDATIYKVNNFLSPPNYRNNFDSYNYSGLMLSRNKSLAINMLDAAINDLNREIRMTLIRTVIQLRILQEFGDSKNNTVEVNKRTKELTQDYINQLFASLPNRKGKSLTTTAITIFQQHPKEDISSKVFSTTKTIILDNFDSLHPYDQLHLLEYSWEKLKTPALIPSIVKILSHEKPPQYTTYTIPIKRLFELDEKLARSFIVSEIINPNSSVDIKVLSQLKDDFLPEVDDLLLTQIKDTVNKKKSPIYLRSKTQLAARFASKRIYPELMQIYKSVGINGSLEAYGGLLAYFLRHNEKEAIPLIEERLKTWESHDGGFHVFSSLNQVVFPNGLEKLLRNRLQANDSSIASLAAYFLSKNGGKENRKLIEKRYQQWLKIWQPRKPKFDKKEDKGIQAEKMFQINLVEALKNAKSWKLTPKEMMELKQTCLSEDCLKYFPIN